MQAPIIIQEGSGSDLVTAEQVRPMAVSLPEVFICLPSGRMMKGRYALMLVPVRSVVAITIIGLVMAGIFVQGPTTLGYDSSLRMLFTPAGAYVLRLWSPMVCTQWAWQTANPHTGGPSVAASPAASQAQTAP